MKKRAIEEHPRTIQPHRVSRGHTQYPGSLNKRTVVGFDDETHEQIAAIAIKRGHSFAETVRRLVEIGLEDETRYDF